MLSSREELGGSQVLHVLSVEPVQRQLFSSWNAHTPGLERCPMYNMYLEEGTWKTYFSIKLYGYIYVAVICVGIQQYSQQTSYFKVTRLLKTASSFWRIL